MTGQKENKLNRPIVARNEIDDIVKTFLKFLDKKIEQKGDHAFSSRHEILGCMTEEYYELIGAVHAGSNHDIRHELFDIAVAALFGAASVEYEHTEW